MGDKDPEFSSHKFPSTSQVVEEVKELWSMALPVTAMNFNGSGSTWGGDGVGADEPEHGGADVWVRLVMEEEGDDAEVGLRRRTVQWVGAFAEACGAELSWDMLGVVVTTSMMYTVPMALAGCVSARVGNELGAAKPYKAKLAAVVALGSAFIIGFINVTWTVILRERWAGLFTEDKLVNSLVASVMPIMGLCELGNCPQTTGCGILRGTARPVIGAHINLGSFYFVGTPVAVGLAFLFEVGFSGLWFGLLSAQVACAVSILFVVLVRTDWEREASRAEKLNGVEMGGVRVKSSENDDETNKLLVNGSEGKAEIF
ncbi:hypothetical protein L6164_007469 [Bauhinia variegata]|uniref:Uncharacterized protein n=1 Tax=Bauhinia variegata TaxID=167791 RepID=A0ACB9PCX8_BAUVA|nr:hypothetical protein L6164_007469 [Bauhinia variegata]